MKRIIFVVLFCLSFRCLPAQTTFGLIASDPRLAFGNMYPYQPMDTAVSPAPCGFEPFYISHFGRHGSRYDTEQTSSYPILETLKKDHDAGLFTEKGERLYRDVLYVREQTEGKNGMLTRLGAREQRQIAERMYRHYSPVFTGGKKIETFTTMVPRVVESRDHFRKAAVIPSRFFRTSLIFCQPSRDMGIRIKCSWSPVAQMEVGS